MLNRAAEEGGAIVVVLPVAPVYAREFVTPEVRAKFEKTIAEVQRAAPTALIVRLDQVKALDSDDLFNDFVHFNTAGRRITTEVLLSQLKQHKGKR